jgi:hypothetical protein
MVAIIASIIVLFDALSSPVAGRVTGLLPSEETSRWVGNPTALINPVLPGSGQPTDWKWDGSALVPLTVPELNSISNAAVIARLTAEKAELEATVANQRRHERIMLEALVVLLVNQFNAVRTNVAVLPAVTITQARTALLNEYQARVDALEAQ